MMRLPQELSTAGRLGRGGFWLRHLVLLPAGLFLCIATDQLLGRPFDLIPALALVLVLLSTWGRRLHDRGRSAWWLLAAAIPVLGPLFLWIECGLRGTTPEAELFGPAPHAPSDYAVVH